MSITRKEWERLAESIRRNYVADGNIADTVRAGSAQRAVSRTAHALCDSLDAMARGSGRRTFSRFDFLTLCGVPHYERKS
jgi:hypothetical protein